jgi:hypothetical protein
MSTKQVLFRLDDSKLIALDNKLSDKGISKQFFLSKCVELFLENKLSFDNNVIATEHEVIAIDNEVVNLKKQIAVIFERLSKLENDNKVIAVDSIIDVIPSQDDITVENTLLESSIVAINEDLEDKLPNEDKEANNSDIQSMDTENDNLAIGTLTQAIDNVILPELAKGNNNHSAIAKMLKGKYYSSMKGKSTDWQSSMIQRALKYRNEGKA